MADNIKELEAQLKKLKLEKQIKEMGGTIRESKKKAVKKEVKKADKKYKGIKGFFQRRGNEEEVLERLMKM